MPPTKQTSSHAHQLPRTLEDVVTSLGEYPVDAYYFVQEGLQFAAERAHGPLLAAGVVPDRARHITGQQLCDGLRVFAQLQWGMMARAVLAGWGIYKTGDFGRIVFAMIDAELWQKQPSDSIADFASVYDFGRAFDAGYSICPPETIA